MSSNRGKPSWNLITSPSPASPVTSQSLPSSSQSDSPLPHQTSQSPFRYITAFQQQQREISDTPLTTLSSSPYPPADSVAKQPSPLSGPPSSSSRAAPPRVQQLISQPHTRLSTPFHSPAPYYPYPSASHPRHIRRIVLLTRLKAWLPIILYALTSLGFILAITMWKAEVFKALDDLSIWLQSDEYLGYAILFSLIFLTTIPPLPLYSTFTILSGYTFGPWTGAIISYFAALSGAVTVFLFSRAYFRNAINDCLSHSTGLKRVIRAIEKRPKLLLLIRLAPYPYNVMNAILAGSPTLTLQTYTVCTALSLFKVILHTSIGSSIHSFANYHVDPSQKERVEDDTLSKVSSVVGILLCVGIAVYLTVVAQRAVDEELVHDLEEGETFLGSSEQEMAERF